MNIEPVIHTRTAAAESGSFIPRNGSSGTNGHETQQTGSTNEHPLLSLLRKELGAEPVR
jgi:hypothetical protein